MLAEQGLPFLGALVDWECFNLAVKGFPFLPG
jgi:hypothetical protein